MAVRFYLARLDIATDPRASRDHAERALPVGYELPLAQAVMTLELHAELLERAGASAESCRLLGACDVARKQAGVPLPPAERWGLPETTDRLRREPGPPRSSELWDQGAAMTLATAMALARETARRPAQG